MRRAALALVTIAAACSQPGQDVHVAGACEVPVHWGNLPDEVRETSGVAASRARAGVFWTHNDSGGDPVLFALDSTGAVTGRVRIRDATNRDWEDVAVAPCPPGSEGDCVYIGDTGDNSERREAVVIYVVPEPDPRNDTISTAALRIEATFPDGARDAEALFVTGAGIHLVSKGRRDNIELFRLPPPYTAGPPTALTRVQQLAPPPTSVSAQVTAAAAYQDRIIVVRTYAGLHFFRIEADTLRRLDARAEFAGVYQPQGEGVDFLSEDRLVLTGEAGGRVPATIAAVICDPERPAVDTALPAS